MKEPFFIHLVAGARPNFMKIAPLYHELKKETWAKTWIIHTGQHYDKAMSEVFFKDLKLPQPHVNLGVGSGPHGRQTAMVLMAYEKILMEHRPDLVVVTGDVNSTLAASLAAAKMGIKTAHLESGLRSFDKTMPEEINRKATDAVADLLWVPSKDACENLIKEGAAEENILFCGNIMMDTLEMLRDRIEARKTHESMGFETGKYGLVTLHRPSNVDDGKTLGRICAALGRISENLPLLFPVHPRTKNNMETFGLLSNLEAHKGVRLVSPMGYLPFMSLVFNCKLAITDSGGIQEETTYLGIPCLTLRPNTERPVTISEGTNSLVTPEDLEQKLKQVLESGPARRPPPALWDGRTAGRIVLHIKRKFLDSDRISTAGQG